MDATDLIKQWIEIAKEGEVSKVVARRSFFQFIACWVAFNAFYTRAYAKRTDREGVTAAGNDSKLLALHQSLLQGDAEYGSAVRFFKSPVLSMKDMQSTAVVVDEAKWSEVVACAYLVRNNLVHGNKSIDSLRDLECVKNAFEVVTKMLDAIVRAGLL